MKRLEYTKGEKLTDRLIFICDYIDKPRQVIVQCSCGSPQFSVHLANIRRGATKSCGCLNNETRKMPITHGDTGHYLHNTWRRIKNRCFNSKDKRYCDWGGRGITMHEAWVKDYIAFKDYIINNLGDKPEGYSLDRIDNNGHYEPNNLRWATPLQQSRNRRNVKLTY